MISGTCLTEASRWRDIDLSAMRVVMQKAPAGAINLALGELGYSLPSSLREHALELMKEATPVYTPNAGLPELRELIAARYGAKAEQVCVCNGAQEALFLSLLSFIEAGDKLAVPDPDYTAYSSIIKIMGANVLRLPMRKDMKSVDWEQWRGLLKNGVKALVLSSPNNPCGFFLKERDAAQLSQICNESGVTVITDEIYKGLVFAGTPASLAGRIEKLFFVSGLSKSHCMSGWRLGWVVAPTELASTLVKAKQYVSTCTGWLAQQLAIYALGKQGSIAADKVFIQLLESRGVALSMLGRLHNEDLYVPVATTYLMLKCHGDDMDVATRLASKGVVVAPGSAFGNLGRGMIRINYGVPERVLRSGLTVITDELYPH